MTPPAPVSAEPDGVWSANVMSGNRNREPEMLTPPPPFESTCEPEMLPERVSADGAATLEARDRNGSCQF